MSGHLFLYSDQEIDENRGVDVRLVDALGRMRPQVAYIASAPDLKRYFFRRKRDYYQRIGIELTAYHDEKTLANPVSVASLAQYDAIHLSGGNTFAFLNWVRKYQLLDVLRNHVANGKILIGTSAGSILMTPSIETAYLCGDTNEWESDDYQSLGLTDFYILPHISTGANIKALRNLGLDRNRKLLCVPDGCGIVVTGGNVECIGEVTAISWATEA